MPKAVPRRSWRALSAIMAESNPWVKPMCRPHRAVPAATAQPPFATANIRSEAIRTTKPTAIIPVRPIRSDKRSTGYAVKEVTTFMRTIKAGTMNMLTKPRAQIVWGILFNRHFSPEASGCLSGFIRLKLTVLRGKSFCFERAHCKGAFKTPIFTSVSPTC